MITQTFSLSQASRKADAPIFTFLTKLKTHETDWESLLKTDGSAQDIDPRDGFVRNQFTKAAAGADFYREGETLIEKSDEGKLRVTVEPKSYNASPDDYMSVYEFDLKTGDLKCEAATVWERENGASEPGTTSSQLSVSKDGKHLTSLTERVKTNHSAFEAVAAKDNGRYDKDPEGGQIGGSFSEVGPGQTTLSTKGDRLNLLYAENGYETPSAYDYPKTLDLDAQGFATSTFSETVRNATVDRTVTWDPTSQTATTLHQVKDPENFFDGLFSKW